MKYLQIFACLGAKTVFIFYRKYIFVLVKIKTLQEASKTQRIVRIGLKTLTSLCVSWV
jgi:hypothetical protein